MARDILPRHFNSTKPWILNPWHVIVVSNLKQNSVSHYWKFVSHYTKFVTLYVVRDSLQTLDISLLFHIFYWYIVSFSNYLFWFCNFVSPFHVISFSLAASLFFQVFYFYQSNFLPCNFVFLSMKLVGKKNWYSISFPLAMLFLFHFQSKSEIGGKKKRFSSLKLVGKKKGTQVWNWWGKKKVLKFVSPSHVISFSFPIKI